MGIKFDIVTSEKSLRWDLWAYEGFRSIDGLTLLFEAIRQWDPTFFRPQEMKENLKHFLSPVDAVTLSVIAPCFSKQSNVDALVDRVFATFEATNLDGELILIDDGSEDSTWQKISEHAEKNRRVRGHRPHCNTGIEAAWKKGLRVARGHLVCFIDADLQHPPEDIAKLYRAYVEHVPDLVQAVRNPVRGFRHRPFISRGLNFIVNAAFRSRLRDNLSGFVLGRKSAIVPLLDHGRPYQYFQSFLGAAAAVRGYRILEVDTALNHCNAGKFFLNRYPLSVSIQILGELLRYRREVRHLMRSDSPKFDWFGIALGTRGAG